MTDQVNVLLEVLTPVASPFDLHETAIESPAEAERQIELALSAIGAEGISVETTIAPVPMFLSPSTAVTPLDADVLRGLESLSEAGPAPVAQSIVVAAQVDEGRLAELRKRPDVIVWANSGLTLLAGHVDCRPFRPGVDIDAIRNKLDVQAAWTDGFRGDEIVVGIIDEGVDGNTYPISGGFARPGSQPPGSAPVTSHGSMCAADVLIAAPNARLFDYPFLGIPTSGGALQMFQAVLDQRRRDGTPHVTNNSYGFVGVPDPALFPNHEVHSINHPIHRKVREVVAAGVTCLFAAGNCGQDCPSGACHPSGIGPGRSIHASNSLAEVITVAAINSRHERIGYSSQGPGMFERQKPDVGCYSHVFGNFGPGRPGGTAQPFDNGTSAATPVAAGVAAMLLSAFKDLTPAEIKDAFVQTAINSAGGWNADFGHGIIDAGAAYRLLKGQRGAVG
jgi:subtilisin family serine protease